MNFSAKMVVLADFLIIIIVIINLNDIFYILNFKHFKFFEKNVERTILCIFLLIHIPIFLNCISLL